jgi:hypothetical protein
MQFYDWLILGGTGAFLIASILSFVTPWQDLMVTRLSNRYGLGVPAALEPLLRARVSVRSRWGSIAGAVGMGGAYLVFRADGLEMARSVAFGCIGVGGIATGLGSAVASLAAQSSTASPVRIARIRQTAISDYIPWRLRLTGWTIVVGSAIVIVIYQVIRSQLGSAGAALGRVLIPYTIVVALAVVGMTLFEVGARVLLRQGQPAASTDELVWDDALRSSALHDLIQGPFPGLVLSVLYLSATLPNVGALTITAVILTVFVAIVSLIFSFTYRATRQWYLRRLWPTARRRTTAEIAERDAAAARESGARREEHDEAARLGAIGQGALRS